MARLLEQYGDSGRPHSSMSVRALPGGVSSEIYRVDLPGKSLCVKRALPKLRVAADWQVPVERNRWEVEWMRVAAAIVPGAVPAILGEDRAAGCFAMAYLPPDTHPVWKDLLRTGVIETATAAAVGDVIGRIHAATADRADLAARFPTDALFHALRLEPYLAATARAHPELAPRLDALLATTQGTKRVLVHGDFSPKNLLIGPAGPVILDAECAWYGDPGFDLAFVLNHLLLKGAWQPQWRARYVDAFACAGGGVPRRTSTGKPPAACEARAAALLPGLMLARIDGKSPVEYLTGEPQKDAVRRFAQTLLREPVANLGEIGAPVVGRIPMSDTITGVRGRRVWDSRGRPTVEAEITLEGGALGRAIAPAGASRGSREAIDLRDGGARFGGLDVTRALASIDGPIRRALIGRARSDQAGIDAALIALDRQPNKATLGGNATVAVSLAVAHAAAASRGQPLWRYLAGDRAVSLPLPEIQIFGGGAHAGRRIDLQDLMVLPVGATSFEQALAMTAEVYRAAGELMHEAGKRRAWRTKAAGGRRSTRTRKRSRCSSGRSSARASCPAPTSRSRSTSRRRSSATPAVTGSGSSAASSIATA